jgi:hypothetical protein
LKTSIMPWSCWITHALIITGGASPTRCRANTAVVLRTVGAAALGAAAVAREAAAVEIAAAEVFTEVAALAAAVCSFVFFEAAAVLSDRSLLAALGWIFCNFAAALLARVAAAVNFETTG